MAGALPLAKLVGLMVKTVSKPVANQLKFYAKNSERFERYYIALGNALHRLQVTVFRQSHGDVVTKRTKVKDLPPEKALDAGAGFIGDAFVYLVAAGVTVYEYARGRAKEARKVQKQEEEKLMVEAEYDRRINELDRQISSLMETAPDTDNKLELLRGDFERFREEVIRSLQLININTPTLAELQRRQSSSGVEP
ncbi:hypothetical protein NDN08_005083 [Rhodosorus marinus]|uniref:OPA3-like protein n=1 Tax=Rhodosorus marinus TaxID=101924 RepID=A0AAV8V0K2_9RHOD|nr:hypothetical protein NDN08_005083 [Rhodosorus marinus]